MNAGDANKDRRGLWGAGCWNALGQNLVSRLCHRVHWLLVYFRSANPPEDHREWCLGRLGSRSRCAGEVKQGHS